MTANEPDSVPSGQALPAGTRLEEFVIERVLGNGGFGITYLARDARLNRQVVIKENLPAQFCFRHPSTLTVAPRHTSAEDAENFRWSLENFSKESAMLASLDHPGIVKVLRSFEAFGTAYFVMPFVEGETFDKLIEARRSKGQVFSEAELLGLLQHALAALDHLHDRGIYHRDIKPGNILITHDGLPVLIDFGSARQRLSERSMTVVESPGYTPFEQLQSRGNVGPWSDIYALGGTLAKALTGAAPPKANDRIRKDPHVPLANRPDLARTYSAVFLGSIDKALAVEEEGRWQNAGEWLAGLQGEIPLIPARIHRSVAWVMGMLGACGVIGLLAWNLRTAKDDDRTPRAMQTKVAEPTLAATPAPPAQSPAPKPPEDPPDAGMPKEAGLSGFALIPAGEFTMGDVLDKDPLDIPHKVNVSAFYMQKKEVSKAEWDEVRAWGLSHGYTDLAIGEGKLASHPVQSVSWYDVVKWCNAKSEKDSLTPCYYTEAGKSVPYSTGEKKLFNAMVKWNANGYRLPTEAEWEKAARGGLNGKRFPWGDTISHTQANFNNEGEEFYQTGSTGFHPSYKTGSAPYTSLSGSFAANGYGLCDMAGNVWEWCWDRHGDHPTAFQTDPRGADSSESPRMESLRVCRGGGWNSEASRCRVASRVTNYPSGAQSGGFRLARSSGS